MKIYKQGSIVKTKIGNIEAVVIGVCIRGNNVEYNIRYFSNGEERCVWLFDFEIEIHTIKQQAGFGNIKSVNEDCPYILLG